MTKPSQKVRGSVEFTPAVLKQLHARSKGICEGCGINPAEQAHHRKYKSRGGSGTIENALHLCGLGNASGCHQIAHAGAIGEQLGWAIRSGHKPERVPYFRKSDGTWWLLGAELEPMHPETAMEIMHLIGAVKTGLVA